MIKIAAGQETLEKLLSEEQSNHAKMESRSAESRNKAQMERGLMIKEQRSLNEELGRWNKHRDQRIEKEVSMKNWVSEPSIVVKEQRSLNEE